VTLDYCAPYKYSYSLTYLFTHTHTPTHPFNDPLSGTTRVSRYQKGKTSLDFVEARDSEGQLHQLGHMQVCTSLQTDNHASTPPRTHLLYIEILRTRKQQVCCSFVPALPYDGVRTVGRTQCALDHRRASCICKQQHVRHSTVPSGLQAPCSDVSSYRKTITTTIATLQQQQQQP